MPQQPGQEASRVIARRSARLVRLFGHVFRRALLRDFHAMRLSRSRPPPAAETPHLVLYANHPSWWDPIAFHLLGQHLFPGRAGFAPIDAKMLERYGFFERIGVFGLDIGSPAGAVRFRDVATGVLSDSAHILLITAQGRFADARERPVVLKAGISHVPDWCPGAVFVPLALDYVFWDERKPELLVRFGPATTARELLACSARERIAILSDALEQTMDELAVEAIARDHAPFETLVSGTSGVGGVYDGWRRARAWMRGERFSPEHGGPA